MFFGFRNHTINFEPKCDKVTRMGGQKGGPTHQGPLRTRGRDSNRWSGVGGHFEMRQSEVCWEVQSLHLRWHGGHVSEHLLDACRVGHHFWCSTIAALSSLLSSWFVFRFCSSLTKFLFWIWACWFVAVVMMMMQKQQLVGIEKDVLHAFPTIKANELEVGIQEENSQWVSLILAQDSTHFSSVSSFHAKLLCVSLLPSLQQVGTLSFSFL